MSASAQELDEEARRKWWDPEWRVMVADDLRRSLGWADPDPEPVPDDVRSGLDLADGLPHVTEWIMEAEARRSADEQA